MTAAAMERVTCKATSRRSGERCKKAPEPGQDVCRMHGGATPTARAAGAARLLEARIQGEIRRHGWQPVTDPLTHYADLGGEVLAFKDLAREQVNALQDWALTIGGWDGDEGFQAQAEQAKAVVTVYERALDRADKILAQMLRLGLDAEALRQNRERPTREQATQLVAILARVLADPRVTVAEGAANEIVLDALKGLETP